MNNIILNERQRAEDIIRTGDLGKHVANSLSILARYYHKYEGLKNKQLYNKLDGFMADYYADYLPYNWSITIDSQVKKAEKYPLIEIDYIPVTKNELDIIKGLNDIMLERLAFTYLVLAKFYNLRNSDNNGWVVLQPSAVFTLANLSKSRLEQYEFIHELKELGFIELAKRIDNPNIRVTFIDNNSEVAVKVTQMVNVGYYYLKYIGKDIKPCPRCGKLMRSRFKLCNDCRDKPAMRYKTCVDCGLDFLVPVNAAKKCRCNACQKEYRKKYQRELMRKRKAQI